MGGALVLAAPKPTERDSVMNIAGKRTPGRGAACAGLIFGKFRPRALPLLSGTLAVAAALAAAGCSALGGGSAQNVALAGHATGATPALSGTAQVTSGMAGGYQVLTLNDRRDLTFNQLLGINNEGVIAGYFGSGVEGGHPNKGFVLRPPFAQGNFGNESAWWPPPKIAVRVQIIFRNGLNITRNFSIEIC